MGKNIHKKRYLTTIYKVFWVLSKPKELKQSVMEENSAGFEVKWAWAGVRTTILHVGHLQDLLMVVWAEFLWTRGGLLCISFGGTSMVNTPEGRLVRIPVNLPPPLSFALTTRASDSSPMVLTCHMHPASSIRSVPHFKSHPHRSSSLLWQMNDRQASHRCTCSPSETRGFRLARGTPAPVLYFNKPESTCLSLTSSHCGK